MLLTVMKTIRFDLLTRFLYTTHICCRDSKETLTSWKSWVEVKLSPKISSNQLALEHFTISWSRWPTMWLSWSRKSWPPPQLHEHRSSPDNISSFLNLDKTTKWVYKNTAHFVSKINHFLYYITCLTFCNQESWYWQLELDKF